MTKSGCVNKASGSVFIVKWNYILSPRPQALLHKLAFTLHYSVSFLRFACGLNVAGNQPVGVWSECHAFVLQKFFLKSLDAFPRNFAPVKPLSNLTKARWGGPVFTQRRYISEHSQVSTHKCKQMVMLTHNQFKSFYHWCHSHDNHTASDTVARFLY